MKTLAEAFNPRANSLNAVRLVLATAVIIRHAEVIVTGRIHTSVWNSQLVGQLPVDGFFAVSGFLIARSWLRNPNPRAFLIARFARIYPPFWACLVVTAFVFAPISMAASSTSWTDVVWASDGPFAYVIRNASLVMFQHDIAGSPLEVPWSSDWNGSLWTLKWEFLCYIAVLLAGITGLLVRRWTALITFAAAWLLCLAVAFTGSDHGAIDDFSHLGLMYAAGVLIYRYSSSIPASWLGVVIGIFIVLAAGIWTSEYRLIAAIPLAYALITIGSLVTAQSLRLPNDISYGMYIYGFPVEQLLAHTRLVEEHYSVLAVASAVLTAPVALLSWFALEKPVLARAKRLARREGASGRSKRRGVPAS